MSETTTKRQRTPPDPHRPMLRVADLRARWGVSRQTIYVWRRAGRLPEPIAIGPNTFAWPLATIVAIERERAGA